MLTDELNLLHHNLFLNLKIIFFFALQLILCFELERNILAPFKTRLPLRTSSRISHQNIELFPSF